MFSSSRRLNGPFKHRLNKGEAQMVGILLYEANDQYRVQVGTMFIRYGLQKTREDTSAEGEGIACLRAFI